MAGYSNPYVLLMFPELGDDVSVLMRNPQLLPPKDITPKDVPLDEHGQPLDPQQAQEAMYEVIARVIVAWKVYDASQTAPLELGEDVDPVALFESLNAVHDSQPRLGPVTVENVGRMPMRIINRVMEEIGRVADPQ
ncbi:hypothetical protein OS965_02560 [Streptomyces sp. H27-G5]|uniref:hypothetical protein n=1 Tax=Streptomyces sp. H27-G5 TaxID=2996698 RepID=UPI00226EC26C|nr:hypothetical protein [Streptomyces sp. H27-G5]MCY0917059.1 hypothetical protein [Streptomyces sp. H27-G5]